MKRYEVEVTFTEPLLGTVPKNQDIYAEYIASKAPLSDEQLEQELATVETIEEKGWSGFHQLEGNPVLYDYVIKGFFKGTCGALRRVDGTLSKKLTAYKKVIDNLVFVYPRQIPLELPPGEEMGVLEKEMGVLERPLRAETAQGARVALTRSDTCPVGTKLKFTIEVVGVVTETLLREWLDHGARLGMGQWRSGGWGRFSYEIEEVTA